MQCSSSLSSENLSFTLTFVELSFRICSTWKWPSCLCTPVTSIDWINSVGNAVMMSQWGWPLTNKTDLMGQCHTCHSVDWQELLKCMEAAWAWGIRTQTESQDICSNSWRCECRKTMLSRSRADLHASGCWLEERAAVWGKAKCEREMKKWCSQNEKPGCWITIGEKLHNIAFSTYLNVHTHKHASTHAQRSIQQWCHAGQFR